MGTLKLRLDKAPVPNSQLRARSTMGDELRTFLVEAAAQVPEGVSYRIAELGDLDPEKVYSKMWALRERGELPAHIVPAKQKDPATKKVEIYIQHKTKDELSRMRKGRGVTKV